MERYFAHSQNRAGVRHCLVDHLTQVSGAARKLAGKFEAGELGYWVGLWHDLGKFHPDFAAYLECPEGRRGPDHSSAGAVHAAGFLDLLAFAIGGHHAGLGSREDLRVRIREKSTMPAVQEALALAQRAMPALAPGSPIQAHLPEFLTARSQAQPKDAVARVAEFFIRMLFSALVDADFLDTEAHFYPSQSSRRNVGADLGQLWAQLQQSQLSLISGTTGRINRARREIYQHCLAAATRPQGFFRLTAPTGAGKTRSMLGFALPHALQHRLDRVIVAIPYTSIIEQSADVYRGVFGDEEGTVLEHHSAVGWGETGDAPVTAEQTWSRLASQNWDAPIVVTTTVQLFESLFANRPGRCRKLHNLARSVIVLDEVQTLPPGLLEPILDALRQLVEHYHATVVLSTATQPALEESPYMRGLKDVQEIIPDPSRYFQELRRVCYEVPALTERWSWPRVAERMRAEPQALAIVNTKADAMALMDALDDASALHLSTLMCGAHRRETLWQIRRRLQQGEPCRLVSTQVVEAGVDLDFPVVLRAVGPLDRIVQAAGRCNREGRLEAGRVVVFDPLEGGIPPGAYRAGYDLAAAMLRAGLDLHDPAAYRQYFQRLYQQVELDAEGIQALRAKLDFPEVADHFRMIPADNVSVVVRPPGHEREVDRLVEAISRQTDEPRRLLRRLQPYLVNIYSHLLPQYQRDGLLDELQTGLWRWCGGYDPIRGLVPKGQDPETLVV
ncbi:MAG: CRISPR-associated helicase Cas3' [Thermoguttaceae bacterium]|jgi:CRISPR-associated endonuclease/helicase Cas3